MEKLLKIIDGIDDTATDIQKFMLIESSFDVLKNCKKNDFLDDIFGSLSFEFSQYKIASEILTYYYGGLPQVKKSSVYDRYKKAFMNWKKLDEIYNN